MNVFFLLDASDVEEEERLRVQTDNVMNRLNGWGSSLPVNDQVQAETLSRISASLINPFFGLMPSVMSPLFTNINQDRFGSVRNFPWLVQPPLLRPGAPPQHNSTKFDKTTCKR